MNKHTNRIWLTGLLCLFIWANTFSQSSRKAKLLGKIDPKEIIQTLELNPTPSMEALNTKILEYKTILEEEYRRQFQEVLEELNDLRDPLYQYRVGLSAKKLEGINIYHDYGSSQKNNEDNTCVNGWCQAMAGTGLVQFNDLASGHISFYAKTFAEERSKSKPNLWQKKPKYINVRDLLNNAQRYGFLPIDLDLAQRGDFCIQYYRKTRIRNEFGPQHLSLIDQVIPWENGWFELRDWHEGIEDMPYLYRTGFNLPNSYNNIFRPENVYYGYQNEEGKERWLYGKNPNVCQAYGYFGNNVDKAKDLIKQINFIRGQLNLLGRLTTEYLVRRIK